MGGALVTLREGLEAALIVGIVLAYLAKTGNRDRFAAIWAGVAAALAISAITGAALFFTVGELEGRAEELFEGIAMLAAVCVLTWMIFWMRRQAVAIRGELEAKVAAAVATGSALALASVVFFAVLRVGWERALFLFAVTEGTSPLATGIGATLGLLVSVALGIALYRGSHRLNLRQFFAFTGTLLIVFAAGLFAQSLAALQEAGVLPEMASLWNANGLLDEGSTAGKFLTALFGYNGDPSPLEVAAWLLYATGTLAFFLRPLRASRPQLAQA